MQDSLEYQSPVTGSKWLIYFDEDCEVTHVSLNGKNVTPRIIRKKKVGNRMCSYRNWIANLIELKFNDQMVSQMDELLYEKRSRRNFFLEEY